MVVDDAPALLFLKHYRNKKCMSHVTVLIYKFLSFPIDWLRLPIRKQSKVHSFLERNPNEKFLFVGSESIYFNTILGS